MKGKKVRLKSALILLTVFVVLAFGAISSTQQRTSAQGIPTPSPSPAPQVSPMPTPNQVGLNLADYLREFVKYTSQVRNSFIRTVEQPLGGWFDNLAWYLAWIIAIVFFLKMIRAEEGVEPNEVLWYVARLAIFLTLLWWSGDVNGDRIRGDMTNKFGNWGNSLAYGTVNRQNEPSGSYLGNLVKRERESFNENYKQFTENKIMVRVNDRDMPIRYPDGNEGVRLIAAIYTGSLTPEDEEMVKSQAWQIGACFQFLNVGRAIIEFGDYFLLLLQGFLIIAMRLAAPFMLAVGIDRQLAQRVTYPFLWGTAVVCLVMPVLSQVLRFLAFTAGNLAFGIHSNQPYFVYDPTRKVIVAQGSPEYIILIAGIIMVFMGLTLFASPFLSYRLAQGSFLEGVMSVTSGWFSSLSGIGISAATNYLGTQVGLQAEDLMAQKQLEAKMTEATYARIATQQSADAKMQSDLVGATGRYEGAFTNIMGAFNKEMIGIEAGPPSVSESVVCERVDADSKLRRGRARSNHEKISLRLARSRQSPVGKRKAGYSQHARLE